MAKELQVKEFSALPVADDGKTLLYADGEVKQSRKNLSEMLTDEVNNKLDTTAFSTVSGNFLTEKVLDEYAKLEQLEIVSGELLTTAQYANDSARFLTAVPDTYALKTDIPTTVAQLTDSGNYYKKTETSSKDELSTEFAKYVTSSNVTTQGTDYVMTTTGWKVLTLPGGGMTQVIHDETLTGQGNADNSKLGLSQTAYNAITSVSSKLDTTAAAQTYQQKGDYATNTDLQIVSDGVNAVSGELPNYLKVTAYEADSGKFALKSEIPTVPTKVSDLTDSANYYKTTETSGAAEISTALGNKVDKPTSLVNKYLVLRTDNAGEVSGWYDLTDQYYNKDQANTRFVATAYIDTTTLSGNGNAQNRKLGVNTDVIATKDYVDSGFLPTSGGTESGSVQFSVASGKNILAVASAATLIGASRQTTEHYGVDNTALGTTWVGVGGDGMHQGFIKYTDGGDVGALDTTSTIQINIKPENAGYNGEMTLTNVNGSTTSHSKVVNVPTASYSNMSSFDNTNGPNYMLRKTASGFDIGAAVINVTALPQTTEANAYYFVYDV